VRPQTDDDRLYRHCSSTGKLDTFSKTTLDDETAVGVFSRLVKVLRLSAGMGMVSIIRFRSRRSFARLLCGTVCAVAMMIVSAILGVAHANSPRKTYFFASSEACAASSTFSRRECTNAFRNTEAEFEGKAPAFGTKFECVARFRQCECRSSMPVEREDEVFRPVMLGVEISLDGGAGLAMPVLAVAHPPDMFQPRPISSLDVDRRLGTLSQVRIPRSDRFEPFGSKAPIPKELPRSGVLPHARRAEFGPVEFEEHVDRIDAIARAKHLEKLKNAPFIE
jgi:hypothetical protein